MSAVGSADAVTELIAPRLAQRRDVYEAWFGAQSERLARLLPPRWPSGSPAADGCWRSGVSPTARSDVAPRRGRVRAPGDRRQAGAAGARAGRRVGAAGDRGQAGRRRRRHRDGVRRRADDLSVAIAAARAARRDRRSRSRRCGADWELVAAGRRPVHRARSWSRPPTTCCGSSSTCSSSTADCCRAGPSGAPTTPAPSSFLYPFLAEREHDLDAVLADVARVGADEGATRSASCARRRSVRRRRRAGRGRGDAARRAATAAAGCWRSATAARRPTRWTSSPTSRCRRRRRLAGTPGARPDRRRRDPHRDRQRHRRRGDLRAPDHRPRPRRRRAAGAVDQRQLGVSVLDALAQARRQGLRSIALVGYDGGRIGVRASSPTT